MIQLTSGCFCCTLKGALNTAIEELQARGGIERIIVEASGLAEPADTLESLWDPQFGTVTDLDLGPVICVVDTPKFPKIREILGEFYTEQIVHADVVLLNKIDLAKTGELDTMHDDIATLNPNASLIYTEQCDTDLEILLAGKSAKAPEPAEHHHDHEHEHTQFDSLVLGCDGDVGLGAVEKFFNGLDDHVPRGRREGRRQNPLGGFTVRLAGGTLGGGDLDEVEPGMLLQEADHPLADAARGAEHGHGDLRLPPGPWG